jgi:hypothetical protein
MELLQEAGTDHDTLVAVAIFLVMEDPQMKAVDRAEDVGILQHPRKQVL